jgi:hypothetical protein
LSHRETRPLKKSVDNCENCMQIVQGTGAQTAWMWLCVDCSPNPSGDIYGIGPTIKLKHS